MNNAQTIENALFWFNEQIRSRLDRKRITDTGQAKKSLRIQDNSTAKAYKYQSIGIHYLEFTNKGRAYGKRPPIYAIEKWVKSKLRLSGKQAKSAAFAVANKIAEEGTRIFKQNKLGIELDELTKELTEKLTKELSKSTKFEIEQKLNFWYNKAKAEGRVK